MLVGLLLSCQQLRRFKAHVRDDPNLQPQAVASGIRADQAGLEVQVSPSSGMSVLLDGNVLGHVSPVIATELTPGAHTLSVRAMGHYPISLPVNLIAGQSIQVPVFLRARAGRAYDDDTRAAANDGRDRHNKGQPRPNAGTSDDTLLPQKNGMSAPRAMAGYHPATAKLRVQIQADPAAPIAVDGQLCDTESCPIFYAQGQLQIGAAQLRYSINPDDILVIFIPADNGIWASNDTRIKTGSTLFVQRQTLHLKRQATHDGDVQRLTLKRVEH